MNISKKKFIFSWVEITLLKMNPFAFVFDHKFRNCSKFHTSKFNSINSFLISNFKISFLLKSGTRLLKQLFYLLQTMMKNAFYLIFQALFVLKIFKSLSWLFGYVKRVKQLEYIYRPISQEVKATRQLNLAW